MANPRPLSTNESIEILKRLIKRYEDDLLNDPHNRRLQTNMSQLKMRLKYLETQVLNKENPETNSDENE